MTEWRKTKKYNPNGPGYPEAGYWYVLQSEAEERISELQAEVGRLTQQMLELADAMDRNDEPGWADMIRANAIIKRVKEARDE